MSNTRLQLVTAGDRAVPSGFETVSRPMELDFPEPTSPRVSSARKHILVVSATPERYSDLPAQVDFAGDSMTAVANAMSMEYDVILADAVPAGRPVESGYRLVRRMRQEYGITTPIFLMVDSPLPTDVVHAKRHGAHGMIRRDRASITALLKDGTAPGESKLLPEPAWLSTVISALREFLASEAAPTVRSIYREMVSRAAQPHMIDFMAVARESAELLHDYQERHAFVELAKRMWSPR